ncbi:DinB family protein [Alicyclobacillus tolerans]|uniref:Damage-inducible protein DinB n=2 Tax=Alicyclobacillus tolerans TaxID=90970 RepID=A0ABT9LS80_9BACL|nr:MULTISPECIES: DinB family protein [Alicyclobacillus]MDP9727114.1 putative damage-inducible protein DinB [Alicyclobacillus tengchongensis]SHL16667.1 Uncharacterized damage-inducible protein DinB (forms a four-helix bundle) [Alicyclobacillus montanus]
MLKEVEDQYQVLTMVHQSIDQMLEGLHQDDWQKCPKAGFNSIVSILDHVILVEKKFFSAVSGNPMDMDTQLPFKVDHWDVSAVQQAWSEILPYAQSVLEPLNASDLEKPGLNLRVGQLNRRQLITYAIGHTTHHRGQIPLLLKLLKG